MKILNLKIFKKENNELIRDINFFENGVSYIFGNVEEPENLGKTINSLGKTMLLKLLDLVLGSDNNTKKENKNSNEILKKYYIVSKIKNDGIEYEVKRDLENNDVFLDGLKINLKKYIEQFKIKRNLYSKQIILNSKKNILQSYNTNPIDKDYKAYLELLNLSNLIETYEKIISKYNDIDMKNNNNKKIKDKYKINEIEKEKYLKTKLIENLEKKVSEIKENLKELNNIEVSEELLSNFHKYNEEIGILEKNKFYKKMEIDRLNNYLLEINNKMTKNHIQKLYDKVKNEIPELIKVRVDEVEIFYTKTFEDRKKIILSQIQKLDKELTTLEKDIKETNIKLKEIGLIISTNDIYLQTIETYDKYNKELNILREELIKIEKLEDITKEQNEIKKERDELENNLKKEDKIISKYSDFIYDNFTEIYKDEEKWKPYFNISIFPYKPKRKQYINFEFSLGGDNGEGVSKVKSNLFDYLVFKYNHILDFLIQDSSCYNGIDYRQIINMFKILEKIAKEENKQAIICINKYQLGDDEEFIEEIKNNSSIVLSEEDRLFKEKF